MFESQCCHPTGLGVTVFGTGLDMVADAEFDVLSAAVRRPRRSRVRADPGLLSPGLARSVPSAASEGIAEGLRPLDPGQRSARAASEFDIYGGWSVASAAPNGRQGEAGKSRISSAR